MTPFFFFIILAVTLIVVEIIVFQLSFFWLLLIGVGALITAGATYVMPDLTWLMSMGIFLLTSTLISVMAYGPLKKWQNKPSELAGHDAIGQSVKLLEDLPVGGSAKVVWSGAEWSAQLAPGEESLLAGDFGQIVKLEGIRLIIKGG